MSQSKTPAILRIIAEALQKVAGLFDAECELRAPDCAPDCSTECVPTAESPIDVGAAFLNAGKPPELAAPATVDLGSDGLPWDSRINADSRAKVKDGTFRLRQKLDLAYIETVRAELRAAMSAPSPAVIPPPPPVSEQQPTAPPVSEQQPPAAGAPANFAEFVGRITKLQVAGTLAVSDVADVCDRHGLASMPLLASRPDLIPTVWADLEAICRTRG